VALTVPIPSAGAGQRKSMVVLRGMTAAGA
jgi:hypothetical protein